MKLGRTGWDKLGFINAITTNTSITDALVELDGAFSQKRKNLAAYYIKKLKLDISHFIVSTGRFEHWSSKKSLEEILIENSDYTNIFSLKRRLLKADLLENKCYICDLTDWNGKPITLQLDHINGNHFDHRLDNLRMLCPNCHVQQETSHGKRLKGRKLKHEEDYVKYFCEGCGKEVFGNKTKLCRDCFYVKAGKNYNNIWPEDQDLINMIVSSTIKQVAEDLNIPIDRLRNRLKNRKLMPTIKSNPAYKPYAQKTVINWPEYDTLIKMVNENGYTSSSKMLNISPNAIKLRIKRKGLLHLIDLKGSFGA